MSDSKTIPLDCIEQWSKRIATLKLLQRFQPAIYTSRLNVAFYEQGDKERKLFEQWKSSHKHAVITPSLNSTLNQKVCLHGCDIAHVAADVIVNAGNPFLTPGSGVCGAIHLRAGPALLECCTNELAARNVDCISIGDVIVTPGFNLPARFVFHTTGPIVANEYSFLTAIQYEQLSSCYENCLEEMKRRKLRSIAFCAISTGKYGFPYIPAAEIALQTVRSWLEREENNQHVDRIIFVARSALNEQLYETLMEEEYFP